MSTPFNFSSLALSSQDALPSLAVIDLHDWAAVTLVGQDAKPYLQGQVTCDVVSLPEQESTLGAHCDAKGKMRTIFRLFHHQQGYAYIQRQSVMDSQLPELKKYAVFSKVEIKPSNEVILGIAGSDAQAFIDQHFNGTSNVRHHDQGSAIKIDEQRWQLLISSELAEQLIHALPEEATCCDSTLWDLYDIRAALPRIDSAIELEFIPQALNLQAVDGISFKKGCYVGQETVARAKYRGINKRAMFIVTGHADHAPQAGDSIERQVGENWRSGGTVITGYHFSDNHALALVVLPNDLEPETSLRFASDENAHWQLATLPYSLADA
ncbi:tRNA-modifying protein YgfZ [Photobacterium damselae]|uniref:tRNA-modifying protein YgfZ n=1 Tax=Photobacterium damselae TaxID=38293 RepID=UPI003B66ECAF